MKKEKKLFSFSFWFFLFSIFIFFIKDASCLEVRVECHFYSRYLSEHFEFLELLSGNVKNVPCNVHEMPNKFVLKITILISSTIHLNSFTILLWKLRFFSYLWFFLVIFSVIKQILGGFFRHFCVFFFSKKMWFNAKKGVSCTFV